MEEYLCQLRQAAGEAEGTPAEKSDTTPRAQLLALFDIANAGEMRMRGCPIRNAAAGAMPGVEHIVHLHTWARARAAAEALIDRAIGRAA